jgi:ABC-type transport system involved in multi-copper enzyme maturation permease subunit
MANVLNGLMNDAYSLLIGALILMAIAMVIGTWARTRSLAPTLGAVILGVVVIAGVSSYQSLRHEVEDDIDRYIEADNPSLGD